MLNNVIIPKMKSMKLSDYLSVVRNEYSYLQLIPVKSNKNNNTEQIAILVNKMFKQTNKYIRQANKKIIVEQKPKASFYIHITKEKVQFYFMIPKVHANTFKVKFKEIWKHIEIKEVEALPVDVNSCTKFDLHYQNRDGLSLAIDKRNNDLLNANMSIVSMLEENEEVGIFYNFIPTGEKQSNYFKSKTYNTAIKDYEKGKNMKKNKNSKDYILISVKFLIDFINDTLNLILNVSDNKRSMVNPIKHEMSKSTQRKGQKAICKSQTILLAKSDTKVREKELGTALANTFKIIEDDNTLIINEITKSIDIKRTVINHTNVNNTSIEEDGNFISMPSTEVIKQFDMIEHNKVLELKAPKCLEAGEIKIGKVKEKDSTKQVYYSMDDEFKKIK